MMAELPDGEAGMREIASMAALLFTFPTSLKDEHPGTLMEGR